MNDTANAAPIVRPFTKRSLAGCVVLLGVAVAVIHVAWVGVPSIVRRFMAPGAIHIVQAHHGSSCDASDVTAIVAEHCEGRLSCDLAVGLLSQPAKGCTADLAVRWSCGRAPDMTSATVAKANPTSGTSIVCPAPAPEATK